MKKTIIILLTAIWSYSFACTNLLVTRGASADGSTMITYAADSHTRYGQLRCLPAGDYQAGDMVRLYDYGSNEFRIEIPQALHTYGVVGFINDHQVAIGETTWGGIKALEHGNSSGIDYGNLILLALQRASTAREAIFVIDELAQQYGYASNGESFSISDPNEVWLMDIINKGNERGAVWVARRVPEGYISGHANQARITTFPQDKKSSASSLKMRKKTGNEITCYYSHDVVDFARRNGWYNGKDDDFSFADTYNPLTFSGLRACEARVYSMFNRVNGSMQQYEAYAMGDKTAPRLPLWIKPDHKLSLHEVMELMRDHFEGTPMDMTKDVGAGPFHCPYRWRPMEWEIDGQSYIHERAISTQQTGFSFVAQCRSWLPNKLGGIIWFGVDDTYSTCYCPMYCGINQVPVCFEEGNGSMSKYSSTAAFWLFNRVANFCYSRYDLMILDVRKVQHELEEGFIADEHNNAERWANEENDHRLVGALNYFSNQKAELMMRRWNELDQMLIMKYIDGNVKHEKDGKIETTSTGTVRYPDQPRYPDWYYRQIISEKGTMLKAND